MSNPEKTIDPEKEKRKIKSVKRMKDIMTHYYIDAKTADQTGKKVAWITSGGPVEPLIAMDVIPVYPENHGAMIGAAKMGVDLCEKAEEMGYAGDLCSYARADIACATVDGGPIGVMLHEHDTGRAHVAAIRESIPAAAAGSAEALENIRRHAALFIELLRQHIHKEDNILFRMARTLLTPADLAELQEAFAREDNPKINHATRDRYQALAAQLAGTPACVALD